MKNPRPCDDKCHVCSIMRRVLGGKVLPGMPYLVGECGPELIVPKDGQTVIPKDDPA